MLHKHLKSNRHFYKIYKKNYMHYCYVVLYSMFEFCRENYKLQNHKCKQLRNQYNFARFEFKQILSHRLN